MCLYYVSDHYDPPLPEERDAYKLLYLWQGELFTPFMNVPVKKSFWLRAEGSPIHPMRDFERQDHWADRAYQSGWHVFDTLEDATRAYKYIGGESGLHYLKVVRVRVRGVRAKGIDASSTTADYIGAKITTLVADEIYVPETA